MDEPQTKIQKISTSTLRELLGTLEAVFPTELGVKDFYGKAQTTWSIPEIGLAYKSTQSNKDLENWIEDLTEQKNIRLAYAKIFEEVEARNVSKTKTPEYKDEGVTQTTITEKTHEGAFRDVDKIRESTVRARERAKKDVQRGIERQQELYKQSLKNKKVVVVPTEEISTVSLNETEKETLKTFSEKAKQDPATTKEFIKTKIEESIAQSSQEYKKNITPPIIEKTAVSITENLKSLPNYKSTTEIPNKIPTVHPASPLVALTMINNEKYKGLITDKQAREKIVEMAQAVALGLETEATVNYAGASVVFGPNIASAFYGPEDGHITQFEIADNQEEQRDEGIELDVGEIYDYGEKFLDTWKKISSKQIVADEVATTTMSYIPTYTASTGTITANTSTVLTKALPAIGAAYGLRQGVLLQQWATSGGRMLPGGTQSILQIMSSGVASGQTSFTTSSSAFIMSEPIGFSVGKFSVGFVTGTQPLSGTQVAVGGFKIGRDGSMFIGLKEGTKVSISQMSSQAGAKGATSTLAKVGSQIATKALPAASGFLTKALTFIGGLSSWATAGLSLVGGYLLGKVIEKIDWAKVKKAMPYIAGLLVGAPVFAFAGPVAGAVAGIGTLGILGGTAGLAAAGAGFVGGIRFLFKNLIGPSIIAPIAITMLVLPVLVAFILLVINSGAYLVPPAPRASESGNVIVSPYIDVIKKPNPPGPFENSDLPLTVEYSIEIKAKKGPLSNIVISYSCNVIKADSSTYCPEPEPSLPTTVEGGISPVQSFVFTYTQTYDSLNFQDSFVTDTVTVKADSVEQPGVVAAGSATIKIGEPPEECPAIWPTSHGYITQGARTPSSCGNNCSHKVLEAIDIGVSGVGVFAGHSGIITTSQHDSCLGNYIQIESNCGGKDFVSRYAHLEGPSVSVGDQVTMGQQIGLSGNTGSCTTGAHLHYGFRYTDGSKPSYSSSPPYMMSPYIPSDVPRSCKTTVECGVSY